MRKSFYSTCRTKENEYTNEHDKGTIMTTILHINSSVRRDGSVSRQLTGEFIEKWTSLHPDTRIIERDLSAHPIPHLSELMMGAFFTPDEQRTAEQATTVKLSDGLLEELFAADIVVIGAPMYNFSVASSLKAWIDHVARAGITFKYTSGGPAGLVKGKKVYVFTSRGGVYSEGDGKGMDFHETYLRGVLGFMGMEDVTFIHTEGLSMGQEAADQAMERTRKAIAELT
jgi:FMN-dependent NADH-azoreductase